MMNSVSFCGRGTTAADYRPAETKSRASKGAKIGAGVGLANSALSIGYYAKSGLFKNVVNACLERGVSKAATYGTLGVGFAIGTAISMGIGALAGAGIGKIVDKVKGGKAKEAAVAEAPMEAPEADKAESKNIDIAA